MTVFKKDFLGQYSQKMADKVSSVRRVFWKIDRVSRICRPNFEVHASGITR